MIRTKYTVNKETLAILPARAIDYRAIVLEKQQTYHIRQTPLEIIKNACIEIGFSTLKGKQEAVKHHTDLKYKLPIPISIAQQIYAFPTQSILNYDCSWIFYHHIMHVGKLPSNNKPTQTTITFKNKREMNINVSPYIIQQQMNRTFLCTQQIESVFRSPELSPSNMAKSNGKPLKSYF